jgi:DNA-binding GntR family transcriptional regulator
MALKQIMAVKQIKRISGVDRGRKEAAVLPDLTTVMYDYLFSAIIDGTFPPGFLLRQEELAAKFGTSRVPLREALRQLEAQGLVVLRPRRGYAVAHLNAKEIVEVLQLRMLIEGYAGYVATLSRTPKDVKALEACVREMDKLPTVDPSEAEIARWSVLNLRFHDTLVKASACMHLWQIAANVQAKIIPYIRMELSMAATLGEAHVQHHQILDAFRKGDADRVAIISRKHCEETGRRFVEALQERNLVPELSSTTLTDLGPAAMLVERPVAEGTGKDRSNPISPAPEAHAVAAGSTRRTRDDSTRQ